ncbi:MAG: hypothetical protein ACWGOX_12415 [Desulforhopalus sp.]
MKKHLVIVILLLVFCGLTACSDESREFTYYKSGEYKGNVDPLLAKDLHEELNHRFMEVQTDR